MLNYPQKYNPGLLKTVSRKESRQRIGWKSAEIPFFGVDIWNCYEFSFLLQTGKPFVGILRIEYSSNSEFIVESKSLKLYLNSFNMAHFKNLGAVKKVIESDLKAILKTPFIKLSVISLDSFFQEFTTADKFDLIDQEKSAVKNIYSLNPQLLKAKSEEPGVSFYLYSNLLKSNCPLTGQPDWGSIYIFYKTRGERLTQESLLNYIISFRNHNEYHEECCERILFDLKKAIEPEELIVLCKYTRRGGIDINPMRLYSRSKNGELAVPKLFENILYSRDLRQ